jgi:integrase
MREREIDLKAAIWTVPSDRMKAGVEHVVPLTPRAVAILRARLTGKPDTLVFPGETGRPISDMTLTMVHRRLGYSITTHGMRSTFRDWAGDCTSFAREIAEMCLAHAVGDAVEQAYRRSTALEKRRELLTAWANYCNRPRADTTKVVPIRAAS